MSDLSTSRTSEADLKASSQVTLISLNQVDDRTLSRLSTLALPEVVELKEEIADIFPAGNLPGLILAGLIALKGRKITRKRADDDINALFQGANLVPQGLYSVLIGGPAVVLSAYQMILRLAGKDTSEAFPEGTWQFYLQFGLREDTGRHTNETIAYHQKRPQNASLVDDISAWLMTAIYTLFDTDGLNSSLWTEWTTLRLIREAAARANLADKPPFNALLRSWQSARPYQTLAGMSYAEARRNAFDTFIKSYIELLPTDAVIELGQRLEELSRQEQEPFQRQMSLLATLKPGRFRDDRVAVPLWQARVGLIWRGHIYLFGICARDSQGHPLAFNMDGSSWPLKFNSEGQPLDQQGKPLALQGGWLYRVDRNRSSQPVGYLAPVDPARVKGRVEAIVHAQRPPSASNVDLRLVEARRGQQERLRSLLPESTRAALDDLADAPILVNWDPQDRALPLGVLRRLARRGVGDHPLTIMRTTSSIIFDQSHIFFDGLWGMAMAEVMTNQAVNWAHVMLNIRPQAMPTPQPLTLVGSAEFEAAIEAQACDEQTCEVDAETTAVDLESLERTRNWIRQRGAMLSINDLLLLARILHAAHYRPSAEVARAVAALPEFLRDRVVASLEETSIGRNPALLIPMDASFVSPHERLFPATFRNMLTGLPGAFEEAVAALKAHESKPDDQSWATLEARRNQLFAYLRTFGDMLDAIKAIAMRGESVNTATLKMLAYLPASMQHLLNQIPERVSVLNEVLKGEEVFSNVGRVARGSSLVRFMSAKDDGRAKALVWGILTDDQGQMHISLRDFRPHVAPLLNAGHQDLAVKLARDYVESYAETLNVMAQRLGDIATAEDVMRWQ